MAGDYKINQNCISLHVEVEELKPCPFCGSTNINLDECTVRVRCKECFASSPLISRFLKYAKDEREAAKMAWNTRRTNDAND